MNCIPKNVVTQLIKAALERANVPQATGEQVTTDVNNQMDQTQVIHGRVAAMSIEPSGFQTVTVIAPDASVDFFFGQNAHALLAEFARAQANNCGVTVFYIQSSGSFPLISHLNVYSPSDPSTPVSNILSWPLPTPP